jgi:hypothetical protein
MTVQIFMRGDRFWKMNNNGATATSASATVYYFSADSEPRFVNYQTVTNIGTATAATASIVVRDTYNVYENPVALSTGNDIA